MLQKSLEEHFPQYTIFLEEAGDFWGLIKVEKSSFTGIIVRLFGNGQVVLKPYVPGALARFFLRADTWLLKAPYFCFSRHLREMGAFLVEKFGQPRQQPDNLAGIRRWTVKNAFWFVILPLAVALFLLSFVTGPWISWRELTKSEHNTFLLMPAILAVSLTLLYLSNAMDDLPDRLQVPYLYPLLSFGFYAVGAVGMILGGVGFLAMVLSLIFPEVG
jgi:hypothetical protein